MGGCIVNIILLGRRAENMRIIYLRTKNLLRRYYSAHPGNLLVKLIKNYLIWNNRWLLSVVLRYMPIVDYIKAIPDHINLKIVEIGSNSQGIGFYLKWRVMGLDLLKNECGLARYGEYLDFVQGDATSLPFKDNSFDIIVSVDMLEHLDDSQRERAISEMVRVSKRWVILALPFKGEPEKYEKKLNDLFLKKYGKNNPALEEHKLPDYENFLKMLKEKAALKSKKTNLIVTNNLNLKWWYLAQYLETIPVIDFVHRILFSPLFYVFKYMNQSPCYRKIIFMEIVNN